MPLITSLTVKLQADFPQYSFASGEEFRWSPKDATVFYEETSDDCASLLHELSHAILSHKTYQRDITLLEFEREAWRYAQQTLAKTYGVTVSDDQIEDSLDTYRDWLHARSTCPSCGATGIQSAKNEYKCVACRTRWRVNDARICTLRRYKLTT